MSDFCGMWKTAGEWGGLVFSLTFIGEWEITGFLGVVANGIGFLSYKQTAGSVRYLLLPMENVLQSV